MRLLQVIDGDYSPLVPTNRQRSQLLPFTFSFDAQAVATLTVIPWLKPTLTALNLEVTIELRPYVILEVYAGSSSACRGTGTSDLVPPSYRTFYGMDAYVRVGTIKFAIAGAVFELGRSVGLPAQRTFGIISRSELSCSYCSGCIQLPDVKVYGFQATGWSLCRYGFGRATGL